jgi:hypothetical protein
MPAARPITRVVPPIMLADRLIMRVVLRIMRVVLRIMPAVQKINHINQKNCCFGSSFFL